MRGWRKSRENEISRQVPSPFHQERWGVRDSGVAGAAREFLQLLRFTAGGFAKRCNFYLSVAQWCFALFPPTRTPPPISPSPTDPSGPVESLVHSELPPGTVITEFLQGTTKFTESHLLLFIHLKCFSNGRLCFMNFLHGDRIFLIFQLFWRVMNFSH